MDPKPSASVPAPPSGPSEIRGRLAIDGERKSGVYGDYWNVVITPDGGQPPIPATLSEKVWSRAGLPPVGSDTSARVTARRNASGRWNVTDVEVGPKALDAVTATVIGFERAAAAEGAPASLTQDREGQSGDILAYRFRLQPIDGEAFDVRVLARTVEALGIGSLPEGLLLISGWTRESWGWKLNQIADTSLHGFFQTGAGELPTTHGRIATDWRFDDNVKDLTVNFDTGVPGLSLRCRLMAHTLRSTGIRALTAGQAVTAQLALRDGRWRLAELLEPRPDLRVPGGRKSLYAVETSLAFREMNNFGELVNWLDIQNKGLGIAITSLSHAKLVDIDEGDIEPGARIVCDLQQGKRGWYASRIHRIADQAMAGARHPGG